jgi:hypothetical protein
MVRLDCLQKVGPGTGASSSVLRPHHHCIDPKLLKQFPAPWTQTSLIQSLASTKQLPSRKLWLLIVALIYTKSTLSTITNADLILVNHFQKIAEFWRSSRASPSQGVVLEPVAKADSC